MIPLLFTTTILNKYNFHKIQYLFYFPLRKSFISFDYILLLYKLEVLLMLESSTTGDLTHRYPDSLFYG